MATALADVLHVTAAGRFQMRLQMAKSHSVVSRRALAFNHRASSLSFVVTTSVLVTGVACEARRFTMSSQPTHDSSGLEPRPTLDFSDETPTDFDVVTEWAMTPSASVSIDSAGTDSGVSSGRTEAQPSSDLGSTTIGENADAAVDPATAGGSSTTAEMTYTATNGGASESSIGETGAVDAGTSSDTHHTSVSETSDSYPVEPYPVDPGACNVGEFGEPELVMGIGYTDRLWGPTVSPDGNTLFFGYTGSDEDLYQATARRDRARTFEDVTPLAELNTSGNEGTPFITRDALSIYFYATREGGPGDRDLWYATRAEPDGEFGNPRQVAGVNGTSYDHLPWLSDDELTIYYTTLRDGGIGRSDIWQASRPTKDAAFVDHRPVPGINTEYREDAIAFSPDRLTVYFTTDRETDGNLDIWQATRVSRSHDFSNAAPIDHLNSDAEDTNLALTRDGKRLYFSSGRQGAQRLWVSVRTCP